MTAEREGLAEEVMALADVIFENSDEPMWSAVVIAKAQWDALADLLAARDRRVRAEAWDEGHRHRQRRGPDECQCYAYSESECGCGLYGTGRLVSLDANPYRIEAGE